MSLNLSFLSYQCVEDWAIVKDELIFEQLLFIHRIFITTQLPRIFLGEDN